MQAQGGSFQKKARAEGPSERAGNPRMREAYFFPRFLRPSASFSASPSFCAIFFFASE
jgi:hypothetical protein